MKASASTHSNNFREWGRGRGWGWGRLGAKDLNNNFRSHKDQSQGRGRAKEHEKKSKIKCFKCKKFDHYASKCIPNFLMIRRSNLE